MSKGISTRAVPRGTWAAAALKRGAFKLVASSVEMVPRGTWAAAALKLARHGAGEGPREVPRGTWAAAALKLNYDDETIHMVPKFPAAPGPRPH